MQNNKVQISIFNRYLILIIFLLFSFLFYLSIPALYNYEKLQKDLTKKIFNEFNLNISLSGDINYKILPTPNFEVTNVILSTGNDENFDQFAQIKKIRINIFASKLFNQKNLEIKEIVFLNGNFSLNKNSYKYLANYFTKENSSKKLYIKKGNIFFEDKKYSKDAIVFSSIKKSEVFYDKKNYTNNVKIEGSIFNTDFDFIFSRKINNSNKSNFRLNFRQIKTIIKNEFYRTIESDTDYKGTTSINILNSKFKINYKYKNDLIYFSSEKPEVNKDKFRFEGSANLNPFYFDININLNSADAKDLFDIYLLTKNLFNKNILLHDSFNGELTININSLKKFKFFDKAEIHLNFINGKLVLDNSFLISDKIGKITFIQGVLNQENNEEIFKSKILFEINNQKKFYQTFQILKKHRLKLEDIYIEIEKELGETYFRVQRLEINSNRKDILPKNYFDLTEEYNYYELKELNSWFAVKKLVNQVFSKIN